MVDARGAMLPNVYTIGVEAPFADTLIAGLIDRHGGDPMQLAKTTILLPNNRAIRAVRDAFIRRADRALLLPRMIAIGDTDLAVDAGDGFALLGDGALAMAPVIDTLERAQHLARLVQDTLASLSRPVDAAEAYRLGALLGVTLDALHVNRKTAQDLAAIDLDALQTHWKKSLIILQLLAIQWPAVLAGLGKTDLAAARNAALDAVAAQWKTNPPAGPVIAAGISTTAPAVLGVLHTITRMETGSLVLAGLDLDMPDAQWEALGDPLSPDKDWAPRVRSLDRHPQFSVRVQLDALGLQRGDVQPWQPGKQGKPSKPTSFASARRALASAVFVPAEFSADWHNDDGKSIALRGLTGIAAIELRTPHHEAQAIALMMREQLEHPGKTAALVTPDRALAERVSAVLERWGISADDSAGQPLSQRPAGGVMIALAQAVSTHWAPVDLIALLIHPLMIGASQPASEADGLPRRQIWLDHVRALDRLLRGPRPAAGLGGVSDHIRGRIDQLRDEPERAKKRTALKELLLWWQEVADQLSPLDAALAATDAGPINPAGVVDALRQILGALCGPSLWQGLEGRALADRLTGWQSSTHVGPNLHQRAALPDLVRNILADVPIRKPFGGHPRLFIWGTLEARLQTADRIILGGLNEGVWPRTPAADPWLAPGVRKLLNLPGADVQTGLAAQDFATGFSAQELVLTRAARDDSKPLVASRFWLRLKAFAGAKLLDTLGGINYADLATRIDAPDALVLISAPMPNPPLAHRPKRISVTAVDLLLADPFSYYARHVLKLLPLDLLDAIPNAAWRGTAVHAILQHWAQVDGRDPAKLLARAQALLNQPAVHALTRQMWLPRLNGAMRWVASELVVMAAEGRIAVHVEMEGVLALGDITLSGKADRIDAMLGEGTDDGVAIVDYKTGSAMPKAAARRTGFALQLGLLGLIAERGGFAGKPYTVLAHEYWLLGAKGARLGDYGKIAVPQNGTNTKHFIPDLAPGAFAGFALAELDRALDHWLRAENPFPVKLRPQFCVTTDYDHLMRYLEIFGRSDDALEGTGA